MATNRRIMTIINLRRLVLVDGKQIRMRATSALCGTTEVDCIAEVIGTYEMRFNVGESVRQICHSIDLCEVNEILF